MLDWEKTVKPSKTNILRYELFQGRSCFIDQLWHIRFFEPSFIFKWSEYNFLSAFGRQHAEHHLKSLLPAA